MQKWIERISNIGGAGASVSLVLMTLMILVEIFYRLFFGKSILIAQEFSGYILIFFAFTSLGIVLKKNRHISIEVITSRLSKSTQDLLALLSLVVAFILVVYVIFWSMYLMIDSIRFHELPESPVPIPLWIPKAFIPLGLIIFALQLIACILERITKLNVPSGK